MATSQRIPGVFTRRAVELSPGDVVHRNTAWFHNPVWYFSPFHTYEERIGRLKDILTVVPPPRGIDLSGYIEASTAALQDILDSLFVANSPFYDNAHTPEVTIWSQAPRSRYALNYLLGRLQIIVKKQLFEKHLQPFTLPWLENGSETVIAVYVITSVTVVPWCVHELARAA